MLVPTNTYIGHAEDRQLAKFYFYIFVGILCVWQECNKIDSTIIICIKVHVHYTVKPTYILLYTIVVLLFAR